MEPTKNIAPDQPFGQKGKNRKKQMKIAGGVLGFLALVLLFLVIKGLPPLEQLENPSPRLASNVYSTDGELVGRFFRQNRIEISVDSIPKCAVDALVATEDRKFYDHWGVDAVRFIKAMFKNVFLFRREGASTLTQQLAKNLYDLRAPHENKLDVVMRKFREWITAVQIEKNFTKSEILGMYFNISYFGHGAYGLQMASKTYFNKNANELELPEAAVLISLLKSPTGYDPYTRYDNAFQRRNTVLSNMVEAGYISDADYQSIKNDPIRLATLRPEKKADSSNAPYFMEYVRQKMEKLSNKYNFDLYEDGLSIYSTLDSRMQTIANKAVQRHLTDFQKTFDASWNWSKHRDILNDMVEKAIRGRGDYKAAKGDQERLQIARKLRSSSQFVDSVKHAGTRVEVGFVALDVKTGDIRAMVGGRDQKFAYGLNHVTQIRRQPGSAFKPILYTAAIQNGLTPNTVISNAALNYNGWSPKNFDSHSGGSMSLRSALKYSVNIISARLITEGHVKLWQVDKVASALGIRSKLNLVPAISLGVSEVTPLEITSAYGTIANKGLYNEPCAITKIEDKDGFTIAEFNPQPREAISEDVASTMTSMLEAVINEGTGRAVRSIGFVRPAAGKTGTTQDYADAWFIGFTPQLVAGVWVGFDDHRISFTGAYGQGSRAALPIWAYFMSECYSKLNLPMEYFNPKEAVQTSYGGGRKDSTSEEAPVMPAEETTDEGEAP